MRILATIFSLVITLPLISCQRESGIEITTPSLPVQTLKNVSYGSDPSQKMDIYLPAGRTDTTKVIVMVHGGSWISGDKSEMNPYISVLQQRLPGYAIVNINYRLASTFANYFPTQENDMKAVVDHLIVKGGEYKISQTFVLFGASAGAHMAMLQAYKYNTPVIKAVVDFFGPTDMVELFNNTTDPNNALAFQILMGGTPSSNPDMYYQSSPMNFITEESPPTIIFHGENDNIVPLSQSISLKNKLQSLGVEFEMITYPGLGHEIWPDATMNDAFNKIEAFIKVNVQ